MEQMKADLLEAKRELALQSFLKDVAEKTSSELNRQIEILNAEVSALKHQLNRDTREMSTQTGEDDPTSCDGAQTVRSGPDQSTEDSLVAPDLLENGIESLAETLRQTAESAVGQSGYIMDAASGMYYDYKSGYYYDPNTCLLYDPHSGTYYTYNEETQGYEFHSKVDLSQYGTPQSTQEDQKLAWETKKKAKKKERRKKKESTKESGRELEDTFLSSFAELNINTPGHSSTVGLGRSSAESSPFAVSQIFTTVLLQGASAAKKSEHSSSSSVRNKKHHRRRKSKHRRMEGETEDRDRKHSRRRRVKDKILVEKDIEYIVISDEDMSPQPGEIDGEDVLSDNGGEMESMEVVNDRRQTVAEGESGKQERVKNDEVVQMREIGLEGVSEGVKGTTGTTDIGETAAVEMGEDGAHDGANHDENKDLTGGAVMGERVDHRVGTCVNDTRENDGDQNRERTTVATWSKTKNGELSPARKEGPVSDSGASEMEEGELSDSSGESYSDVSEDASEGQGETSSSGSSTFDDDPDSMEEEDRVESPVNLLDFPPCVRLIVTDSERLQIGSLHIVTVLGGTIGREGADHVIKIPELMVSKRHAEVTYSEDKKSYAIRDLGSQNGTLLNGNAIAMGRVESELQELAHRDVLQFGTTVFEVHIHQGNWTCPGCEPGVVQAKLSTGNDRNVPQVSTPVSRSDKEALRRKELKKIKKKYDLVGDAYKVKDPALAGGYVDRAEERRRVVGSDNPHQKDDAPSSVNRAIDGSNRGHQMLLKMGWKEGESLGAGDTGIKEPIQVGFHSTKAGLGSCAAMPMDMALNRTKKISFSWSKSRERMAQLEPLYDDSKDPEPKYTLWVQGRTQVLGGQTEKGGRQDTGGDGNDAIIQEKSEDASSTDRGGQSGREVPGKWKLASGSEPKAATGSIDMFE